MTSSPGGRHLHLDLYAGIAGDMSVAALVDVGVPENVVLDAVNALDVPGLACRFEPRRRGAFVARGFTVSWPGMHDKSASHSHAHSHHGHGVQLAQGPVNEPGNNPVKASLGKGVSSEDAPADAKRAFEALGNGHANHAQIRARILQADLSDAVQSLACRIFQLVAEVEGELHGEDPEHVGFHEVGAYDSIADIVGFAAAFCHLAPTSVSATPPVVGTGSVWSAHGRLSVPAPATTGLLKGIPFRVEGDGELTTPTGAAIVRAVVQTFKAPGSMTVHEVGYGAGTKELQDRANVVKAMLGACGPEAREGGDAPGNLSPASTFSHDSGVTLEDGLLTSLSCNIDDMPGELIPGLLSAIMAAGAVDVWCENILMKKGRPGLKVSALARPDVLSSVATAFFSNSSTIGLRFSEVQRFILKRASVALAHPSGTIQAKRVFLPGAAPERHLSTMRVLGSPPSEVFQSRPFTTRRTHLRLRATTPGISCLVCMGKRVAKADFPLRAPGELLAELVGFSRSVTAQTSDEEMIERFHQTLCQMLPGRWIGVRFRGAGDPETSTLRLFTNEGGIDPEVRMGPVYVKTSALSYPNVSENLPVPEREFGKERCQEQLRERHLPAELEATSAPLSLPLEPSLTGQPEGQLGGRTPGAKIRVVDAHPRLFSQAADGFSVPLLAGGSVVGDVHVNYRSGAQVAPLQHDQSLVIPMANHVAVVAHTRRLLEQKVQLQGYLEQIIDQANVLILATDTGGKITIWNRAMSNLTGLGPGQMTGLQLKDWLDANGGEGLEAFGTAPEPSGKRRGLSRRLTLRMGADR